MKTQSLKDSIVLRMVIVAVLGIVLLVPISLVSGLISEREHTRNSAVCEVTENWGRQQTLVGPILTVPIKHTTKAEDGTIMRTYVEHAHFLPDSLTLNTQISPEIRKRGIYRVVLYNAQLNMEADFPKPLFSENMISDGEILWKEAFITLGISDLKGIRNISRAICGDQPLTAEPGLLTQGLVQAGFTFRMPLSADGSGLHFALDASLNGSEELRVAPLGKQTNVTARSSWGNPSFIGDFLPEKREITDNSFNATWNVLHLNRNLPQAWTGVQRGLDNSSFGVRLILPVDEYQKSSRAVKYAIMFIALTFLAFTIIDVLTQSPFHPIHYTLVGFALILFFVLLLSMSEHLSFNISYFIAGIAVILIISLYTQGVTRRWELAAAIAGTLAALYGFLFVLLQLEDYALLLGSMGLSISLALVMYLTRRIDWFGVEMLKE